MATTLQARRLTEAHRLAQARIGVQTVAAMAAIWPLLDPGDIDATLRRWLTAAVPIIQAQRATSARLAADYLATFKALELGTARIPTALAGSASVEALTTSLLVTGPYRLRKALSIATPLERASSLAEASSSASSMRWALNAGRDTIIKTVEADPRAKGYVRVTSGNACAFCEDLAGKELTTDEAFPAHDGCACSAEPLFT